MTNHLFHSLSRPASLVSLTSLVSKMQLFVAVALSGNANLRSSPRREVSNPWTSFA